MIDLHAHILPDVDDGAPDWDSALAMMALAERAGTTVLAATPHSHDFWRGEAPPREAIPALVAEANERAARAGLALRIVAGQECQAQPELVAELEAGTWLTLGGSRTVLLELPFSVWPPLAETLIFDLQVAGYTVLLAHPERYRAVQEEPNRVLPLVERGVYTQVTTTSLTGHFGTRVQETARRLLEHGLAHVLASDAHSARTRAPVLDEARRLAEAWLGEEAARRLCLDHPAALLQDEPLTVPAPRAVEARPRRKRFGVF